MKQKHNRPAWWVLDLIVLLMEGSLLGVHHLFLSKVGEGLLQAIIVLVFYGLIALWLHANSAAIQHDQRRSRDEAGGAKDEVNLTETQARYRRTMARYKEKKRG